MPTWGEIQEYVRKKYKLSHDDDESFVLNWKFSDERTQRILVRRFNAFDQDWVEFRSAVCKEGAIPHRVALKKNFDFVIGALAIDADGDYVVTYSHPLASMDIDEFELPLHVIARTADNLEGSYTAEDKF